jgi:hypothetical protein
MADLQVNVDSYVTLDDAEAYVKAYFKTTSPERTAWESASAEDKEISLRMSCQALNNLWYKGQKAIGGQPLAFPRTYSSYPGIIYLPYASQTRDTSLLGSTGDSTDGEMKSGIASAKKAQIVNALAGLALSPEVVADVTDRTIKGIRAKKAGSVSESYDGATERSTNLQIGIYAQDQVYNLLNAWLTDAVYSL